MGYDGGRQRVCRSLRRLGLRAARYNFYKKSWAGDFLVRRSGRLFLSIHFIKSGATDEVPRRIQEALPKQWRSYLIENPFSKSNRWYLIVEDAMGEEGSKAPAPSLGLVE